MRITTHVASTSNPEVIYGVPEGVCRLCANHRFYLGDLGIRGFSYLMGVLEPIPHGRRGMRTVFTRKVLSVWVLSTLFSGLPFQNGLYVLSLFLHVVRFLDTLPTCQFLWL